MSTNPSHQQLKTCVRQLYERLATLGSANPSHAPIVCGENLARDLGYDTSGLPIPKEGWDLFAGCGNPLETVALEPEWMVMDLGCGVGVDCQIAARSLQPPGMAFGVDFAGGLLRLAKSYASANPTLRCQWLAGDGENLPFGKETIDLVLANGCFNLIPDKKQALTEIHRVLKPGRQLALADLFRMGEMEPIKDGFEDAWVWCVAGALSPSEFDAVLEVTGFLKWEMSIKSTYGPLAAAHVVARKD
jgi:SAM-dependent methyltransferase